jgi:hypothetical protein
VDGAEEFLGLTMKLLQVGPDGQAADGHDEPPSRRPGSAGIGHRRFGDHVRTSDVCTGGLSPVRGREAPCTPSVTLPPSGEAHKSAILGRSSTAAPQDPS